MAVTNSIPMNAGATNALRDIKPPWVIPSGWAWVLWTALALVLVGAAWWLWRYWRRKKAEVPAAPVIPAHVRAKQKLQEALALLGQPREFCILVSDTIRWYLEERFDFRAPERTTEEFLHELRRHGFADSGPEGKFGRIPERCDLVKFARYEPREPELHDLRDSALRLVEETEPRPEPIVAEGAHAPVSQDHQKDATHKRRLMTLGHPWYLLLLLLLPLAAWLKASAARPPAFRLFLGPIGAGHPECDFAPNPVDISRGAALADAGALHLRAGPAAALRKARPRSAPAALISLLRSICPEACSPRILKSAGSGLSRFNMARDVLKNLSKNGQATAIGLVVFATDAYIAVPLTLDHEFLIKNLDRLDLGVIEPNRTAIGSGLNNRHKPAART
jgi:hypothetical protein